MIKSRASSSKVYETHFEEESAGCLNRRLEHASDMNCGTNMSIVKRWAVTYTKHLKQKRKVYQDGVLELCGSGKKVLLYDDCEKLIDSKFLKNEEVIECGQTLTLETHLVDIGDLEESRIPLDDINVTGIRSTEKHVAGHQNERKKSMLHHRLPQNHSNATSKNEGVNQKMQLKSFGKPESLPNVSRTTVKEWNALYTTQITQKAKKFHDGFLRLSVCGSYMDQVTLLNEEGVVLGSKYVKSSEFIKTGKTFELPNYLVEICELRTVERELRKATPERVANSICSNNHNFTSAREVINNKQSGDLSKRPCSQVACFNSSSFGKLKNRSNMATLDVEDKKVLFHYKVTIPSSPATENHPEGAQQEVTDTGITGHGEIMSRREINKSLRDACQILSTVRKPVPGSNNVLKKLPIELVQPAQSLKDDGRNLQIGQVHSTSNFNRLDVQSKGMILEDSFRENQQLNEPAKDNFKADSCELGAGHHIQCDSSKRSLDSSASEDVSNSGIMSGMGTCYEEKAPLHNSHDSVHILSGSLTSETSADELNVECSEKPPEGGIASASMHGETNTPASRLPGLSHTATPGISFSGEGLLWQIVSSTNETVPFAKSAISTLVEQQLPDSSGNILKETINDIEISTTSGMKGDILRSVGNQNNDKLAKTPAMTTSTKEEEVCESASVAPRPACAAIDNSKKYKESEIESLSTKCHTMEDFPTFDLGF